MADLLISERIKPCHLPVNPNDPATLILYPHLSSFIRRYPPISSTTAENSMSLFVSSQTALRHHTLLPITALLFPSVTSDCLSLSLTSIDFPILLPPPLLFAFPTQPLALLLPPLLLPA
eukprot:c2739_g1_i1 orf=198-554(-)